MGEDEHYLKKELYGLFRNKPEIFDFFQLGALDGVWYWDLEKPENEWMSPEFWKLFGYAPSTKQHLAAEWQDIIFPEDLEVALDNFHKHCADENHSYDQIVRYRHKNGSTVWVRCRAVAIRDNSGKPIRMLGSHNDVTVHKEIEEALRNSEEKFRQFVEHTDDLITQVDNQGNYLYVSSSCLKYSGLTQEEAIGKSAFDFIHPDDREMTQADFAEWLKQDKKSFSHVNRLLHPDGTVFHMFWNINFIKDRHGKLKYINSIARNITSEEMIRKALNKNEILLNATGTLARVGGWELNLVNNEVLWTDQVYHLHEVPRNFNPSF